jgi:hypothetical protein
VMVLIWNVMVLIWNVMVFGLAMESAHAACS